MKHLFKIFAVSFVALLSGCGGGGGSSSTPTPGSGTSNSPQPVASTSSFPLKSGYDKRVAGGHTESYSISGSCSGSATFQRSPTGNGTFGTTPAMTVNATDTFNTQCTSSSGVARAAASGTSNGTIYYNTSYNYLGTDLPASGYYTGMDLPLIPIPANIKVGDTGNLGTEVIYLGPERQASVGKIVGRYVVEPDTANTVIVNEIVEIYKHTATTDELTSTRQERFRIDVSGNITPVSIDSQSNPPGEHLVYTYTK